MQFSAAPPEGLKRLLKGVGGGSFRAPPPGIERFGWHLHDLSELARAVEGKWSSFAKVLREIRDTIRNRPDAVPQPSRHKAAAGVSTGGGRNGMRVLKE